MTRKFLFFLFWTNILVYPQQTWIKVFELNSWPKSVIKTNDSCFLIIGEAFDSRHMFISKIDQSGNIIWQNIFYNRTSGRSICENSQNQFLSVGGTASPIDSFSSAIGISKFDNYGNHLWSKPYILSGQSCSANSIQLLPNDNYIVGFTDIWALNFDYESIGLMKITNEGDTLWTKHLDNGSSPMIFTLSNGGFASLYSKQFLEMTTTGFALMILDNNGNVKMKKIYYEFPGVYANSIIENKDGSFIICVWDGITDKILLININANGDVQKINKYDGRTDYNTIPLIRTKENNYILAGFDPSFGNNNILIYKLTAGGEIIWKKYFTDYSESIGGNVIVSEDGGYIISGIVFDNKDGLYHTVIIKTDSLGSNLSNQPTGIKELELKNNSFALSQNYPNPFNPTTKIKYSISSSSFVTLKVYDLLGREAATLVNEEKPVGEYEVEFDGRRLSSGIYFYSIQAGEYSEIKKMILLK